MATVISLLKSIPGLIKVYFDIKEMFLKYQTNRVEKHYEKKRVAKSRIAKELKEAVTDEQRKELARRLNNLIDS